MEWAGVNLRAEYAQPFTRLIASLVSAAMFAAVALLAGWLFGCWLLPLLTPGARPHVRDDYVVVAATACGLPWLMSLWWIWSPLKRARRGLAAGLLTLALWNVVLVVLVALDSSRQRIRNDDAIIAVLSGVAGIATLWLWVRLYRGTSTAARATRPGELSQRFLMMIGAWIVAGGIAIACDRLLRVAQEWPMGAACLVALAATLVIWLPPVARAEQRLPRGGDEIRVHCPQCGYSLVGLTELRCPECGERFTIDGLIRAQRYRELENADAVAPERQPARMP